MKKSNLLLLILLISVFGIKAQEKAKAKNQKTEPPVSYYVVNLFPCQAFTGTMNYILRNSDSPVNVKLKQAQKAEWLDLTKSNFELSGSGDIKYARFKFVAPKKQGKYETVVIDQGGYYPDMKVILNVTENPPALATKRIFTSKGENIKLADNKKWNGWNIGTEKPYFPDSVMGYSFAEFSANKLLSIEPASFELKPGIKQTINYNLNTTNPGIYKFYELRNYAYTTTPDYIAWEVIVEGKNNTFNLSDNKLIVEKEIQKINESELQAKGVAYLNQYLRIDKDATIKIFDENIEIKSQTGIDIITPYNAAYRLCNKTNLIFPKGNETSLNTTKEQQLLLICFDNKYPDMPELYLNDKILSPGDYALYQFYNIPVSIFKIKKTYAGGWTLNTNKNKYVIAIANDIPFEEEISKNYIQQANSEIGTCDFVYAEIKNGALVPSFNYTGTYSPEIKKNNSKKGNKISEVAKNQDFNVFPNPNTGLFTISVSGFMSEALKIQVFDVSGSLILQKQISNNSKLELNLTDKPKGVYLVKLISDSDILTKKILIEK